MKYTKLFNNHSEYVAYTASTSFIRPNVSYCIQEDEPHCTPMGDTCIEQHIYEIMGEPSYPSSVPASATSFELSFTYTDTYTSVTCDQGSFMDGDTVTIPIDENPSMSARTISGTYVFHDISIPYSLTQEGMAVVVADPVISCDGVSVTITCETQGASIYYKLDHSGDFTLYESAITITADTFVETYATLNGTTSNTVSETCEYEPSHDYSKDYLTLDVLSGGTIMWAAKNSVTKTISYSINDGEWTEITSTAEGTPINVSTNDKVRLKGSNAVYATAKDNDSEFSGGTAYYDVKGNVMSLIGGDDFTGLTSFNKSQWVFHNLFDHSNTISAEHLVLPVMTLTNNCYRGLFANSSSLTTPPELPATTMASSAYTYMFDHCVSLTTAPSLPATTASGWCYRGMFNGCTSLTVAPEISATSFATSACSLMFADCTSLTTAPSRLGTSATSIGQFAFSAMFSGCTSLTGTPELPATSLNPHCYRNMFRYCSSLTATTSLPATVMKSYCYGGMFNGCTSLTVAPSLPATNLNGATSCYEYMFYNCASLTEAPSMSVATTIPQGAYAYMFANCTLLTTSPNSIGTSASTLGTSACTGMFSGCTELTASPELLGASLGASAYTNMFNGCTSLTTAPSNLPATTLGNHCYYQMFRGCTSLTTPPTYIGTSATTMATSACTYMFSGCSSLTVASELPATSLANACYFGTFKDCTSMTSAQSVLPATTLYPACYRTMYCNTALRTAPELPATTMVASAYTYMFDTCTALTTPPVLPAETLADYCYAYMFKNCSSLNNLTCLATDISASNCTSQWVFNVAATGVFTKASAMNNWSRNQNGIPTGWTVQDYGIAEPVIDCDGEFVTITCATPNVDIYYSLDGGSYSAYSDEFHITADTSVSAYAELNGESSTTITQTCQYIPYQLVAPVISCDGENVTITCETPHSTIYYRTDGGSYNEYASPIVITADTVVDAYSSYDGRTSTVVTENCEYDPIHHYEYDYLTFDILTGGTLAWTAKGGVTKTISYSINDGAWTEITSTTGGTVINVSDGDKVRFKGTNSKYGTAKDNCSSFSSGSTAYYNVEGNIMSLIGGDNFSGLTSFNGETYVFHSLFDGSKVVSAENLILPVMTLTNYCYRAMFANCTSLEVAPKLPATTLAEGCYWYMFSNYTKITSAPDLNAETLVKGCYQGMFRNVTTLNYIKCLATSIGASGATTVWVNNVASTGTFVKDKNTTWSTGDNAIPTNWIVQDEGTPDIPTISCNGFEIELSCATSEADIYYKLNHSGLYSAYTTAITITADTFIECYAEKDGYSSTTTSMSCIYDDRTIFEYSNQSIDNWTRSGTAVTVPNSVNAIDGQSSNYAKGTFNYDSSVTLRSAQPTYLWFQHADQSADIYVDNVEVEKHWGGYNAFFTDISNYVHKGANNIKVVLKNNEGYNLAPAEGDFNFNATLGRVKLFTSPCLPAMTYGYDGFHITSTVSTGTATINVATNIPTGASVVCTISGVNCNYTATSASTGNEMIFSTTITNPRLWNGTVDPYLYNVKLEVYYNNELYHRYERPYGLRFYEYVINQTVNGNAYTGFLLNGQPYLLRGCCMHDDIVGKGNALNDADYTQQFNLITDLGLNFLRLAHYPHPKEVYDWCDRLGIIVETEVPCVNKLQTTMPEAYWTHLVGQYNDMVNQHYNHPCIVFWGLSNEAKVDNATFAKTKIEAYTSQIKALDSERMVGLVGHALTNPLSYFGGPTNIDWIGSNLYNGWYQNQGSNNPTSQLNTCISNTVSSSGIAYAFSEYGCGGTQGCHSETPSSTTNKGSGGARHDIEYQMWLHEGHIAAIKNKPELLFTSQWVLFDFAVSNRNEGYTLCPDGENTSTDESLRRLNDKGLVERDHVTKKDTYYLYKAWWNPTPFIHICGKDYTKTTSRVIKCYTNGTGTATLYVNGTSVATATVTDYIAEFTAQNFNSGDVIRVDVGTVSDTFTFGT